MSLKEWIEILQAAPLAFSLFIGLIIFTIVLAWKKRKSILNGVNWYTDRREKNKQYKEMLLKDHDKVAEQEQNRIRDREQSFEIQRQLIDAQNKLAQQIAEISQKIDNNQRITDARFIQSEEKQNKRVRAELKDKIGRTYRYHHELGKINDMEFEALKDLIEEYEDHGGTNSFVHDTVQPEMYVWIRDNKK